MRYKNESKEKSNGIIYTPMEMADFLALEMIKFSKFDLKNAKEVNILDPAIGKGELILSMVSKILAINSDILINIDGYETDATVAAKTEHFIRKQFPSANVSIIARDFLEAIDNIDKKYNYIIANPPYIRTQILGASKAQEISNKMNLSGKIDIYYAFLLYMKKILSDDGISGYITSNKFFTIKSGSSVRDFMIGNYKIHSIVDFGDTKLFDASVLPCIIVFSNGRTTNPEEVNFTSIYESKNSTSPSSSIVSIFDSINKEGLYSLEDGRVFDYCQGHLHDVSKGALWVIASKERKKWLTTVESNTWLHLSDIGKIRVGIKTTADNVFIGNDWTGEKAKIELLRPLITHRDAGQIVAKGKSTWKVLYTHTTVDGKKVAYDIDDYPESKSYLEQHYEQLAGRNYVIKAKRNWYEIWVPQNPDSWKNRKIVFRDISEKPEFWLDETGAIVNGDCYWIDIDSSVFEDTIYLALAVVNSSFIEKYYDAKFNTKLYSGKRRYMTQYVEQFPIPNPNTDEAREAINLVKKIIAGCSEAETTRYMNSINKLTEQIFMTA
ncbi:MAG: N-6 DNA methylase [Hungatella sp.]|jgi:adenine-specific DNA-methyltransferase|nr:N-6 DNA methylase [Hungatella sp.]